MKITVSGPGAANLIEKRSDERDNVKLTNAMRNVLNGQLLQFAQVTSIGAGFTTIWTDSMNADSVVNLEVAIVGVTAAAGKRATYMRRQTAYRIGTGVAVLLGAADTIGTDQESDATWGVSLAVSAGNFLLQVQGGAGDTVFWNARITAVWSPYV